MAHAGPLGSETNPIPRSAFNRVILENFVELNGWIVTKVKPESGVKGFAKVAPTLVLYPNAEDVTAGGQPGMHGADGSETPDHIKTMIIKKGRTFEESLMRIHGKALLLNFCSPSVEVYPKDKADCHQIYDMAAVDANVVPEAALANEVTLKAYLDGQLQHMLGHLKPLQLQGEPPFNYTKILQTMIYSRRDLKRDVPWRMAQNKIGKVLARKLDRSVTAGLLQSLGSDIDPDSTLHREESYDPKFKFSMGDYVVIDLEETAQGYSLKVDSTGQYALVRTVNEDAFEHTYAELADTALGQVRSETTDTALCSLL